MSNKKLKLYNKMHKAEQERDKLLNDFNAFVKSLSLSEHHAAITYHHFLLKLLRFNNRLNKYQKEINNIAD